MRSPKDMRIIQIDITNACVHACSNCTRFCGHHVRPFFMDFETFKRAVDSLKDFDRCIGIMGGEPLIHPEFSRFVEYIGEKYPSKYNLFATRKPIKEFARYMHDKNYILDESLNERKGPGLLTSVCDKYYEHFELIQDTFSFQNINDHQNPSVHQPLLASRREMGVSDEEWIPMRDSCWVQNQWSAAITPKGAFFCEIAGALDMLFDGPGGWKIEPGWWKREPEDFGEQLQWCEICGGALFHSGRLSSEEIDDVSPLLYQKLKEADSPKLKAGCVAVMEKGRTEFGTAMPDTANRYLSEHEERVSKLNRAIFPKAIASRVLRAGTDAGIEINDILKKETDWIAVAVNQDMGLPEEMIRRLKNVVLNPGVLYSFSQYKDVYLFNKNAHALKRAGFDGIRYCATMREFMNLWDADKKVCLDASFDELKNPDLDQWEKYVAGLDLREKEQAEKIDRCIRKIKSDYE